MCLCVCVCECVCRTNEIKVLIVCLELFQSVLCFKFLIFFSVQFLDSFISRFTHSHTLCPLHKSMMKLFFFRLLCPHLIYGYNWTAPTAKPTLYNRIYIFSAPLRTKCFPFRKYQWIDSLWHSHPHTLSHSPY